MIELKDDDDIQRQLKSLYCAANKLRGTFDQCSPAVCGECMITLSLPRSGACNLAILNCAPVFAPWLLHCACGLGMQYCQVFF